MTQTIPLDSTDLESANTKENLEFVDGHAQISFAGYGESEADSKLKHRWLLSEDAAPFVDQIGSADGSNTGTTQVTGDYADGAAREGDGTSAHIETTHLGSFGSAMANDFAVAFSFNTTDGNGCLIAVANSGDATNLAMTVGEPGFTGTQPGDGQLQFFLRDGDNISVHTDDTFHDGTDHRVVFNKTANSAAGLEIWVDQTQVAVSSEFDGAFGAPTDFDVVVPFLAQNNQGTIERYIAATIDDVCFFNDSLTQTEIESYTNPWEGN